MLVSELIATLEQHDKSKSVSIKNPHNIDFDNIAIIGVTENEQHVNLNITPTLMIGDIADSAMANWKELQYNKLLNAVSEILWNKNRYDKDQIISMLDAASKIEVKEDEICIPSQY